MVDWMVGAELRQWQDVMERLGGRQSAHAQGMVTRGFVRDAVVRDFAAATIGEFGVKAGGPEAAARSLSGGNLQKYIVGREIRQHPRVLIVSQPTWGVDVGAAAQIRQALVDLAQRGVAVLVVSEELDELFEICDRLAVIAQGRLSHAKPVAETDPGEIGQLMAGSFVAEGATSERHFSPAGALGLLYQLHQEAGRADIAGHPQIGHHLQLQVAVADAAGHDGAAHFDQGAIDQ
jgi:energy-coupling factor transporter ATP-binding protein EcfA2